MQNIDRLIREIIPPADYSHRNGFSNKRIINNLFEEQKIEVEERLFTMLHESDDTLIGETLTFLTSTRSVPLMKEKLDDSNDPASKIVWASFINELQGGSEEMKKVALSEFDRITNDYGRISMFYYLVKFNDKEINDKIRTFFDHPDYLTAYNARQCLGLDTTEVVERERAKRNK